MRSGKLNKRIVIEQVSEGRDAIGGTPETWSTFATVWAEFMFQTGREFFAAKQTNNALDEIIRIRYLAGVTAKMRVRYGTRIFTIVAPPIDVNESHVEIKLMCEELRG